MSKTLLYKSVKRKKILVMTTKLQLSTNIGYIEIAKFSARPG